jgi:glycosyltransferase involved in cell wall biosynthesis
MEKGGGMKDVRGDSGSGVADTQSFARRDGLPRGGLAVLDGVGVLDGECVTPVSPMPQFLLVIPAYREGQRLPVFADSLLSALAQARLSAEVQVIDDGSPEGERVAMEVLCEKLRGRWPLLRPLISLPVNVGKGGAVYAGWDLADDERWVGFCDADGSVPADEVVRLMQVVLAANDPMACVIATRRSTEGRGVRRAWLRAGLSRLFSIWVRRCTGLSVRDTQCGCKFISAAVYRIIRPQLRERRFVFDVELLKRVVQAGAKVVEEPVNWVSRLGGSLRLWRDGAEMAAAVWRLRSRR